MLHSYFYECSIVIYRIIMKKILTIIAVILFASCAEEKNNFVNISGQLHSDKEGLITIQGRNFKKEIKVNADGTFSDTLKVVDGVHNFVYNKQRLALFLRNGYDLSIAFKDVAFNQGVSFTGKGKETNSYMEKKRAFFESDKANPKSYFKLEQEAFKIAISETRLQLEKLSNSAIDVDSIILKSDIKNNELFLRFINNKYVKEHKNIMRLAKGTQSPKFFDFENYNGGTSSLDDFKGKFVYIDVWATWCGPCKSEIPYLKELEEEFQGKNIAFISLSVDKKSAHDNWRNMIASKNMGGVQLFSDEDFNSEFIKEYAITAIPRFILLDTEGKIIDSDASRPSNPKTKELLNYLVN
ncbi:MAG: hypothetical protein COB60_07530 [Flavobacteriaceae bacterium]|nr:MAG: hypothetical protein COB60_07530 [Flavobacteriaceae bacterium]